MIWCRKPPRLHRRIKICRHRMVCQGPFSIKKLCRVIQAPQKESLQQHSELLILASTQKKPDRKFTLLPLLTQLRLKIWEVAQVGHGVIQITTQWRSATESKDTLNCACSGLGALYGCRESREIGMKRSFKPLLLDPTRRTWIWGHPSSKTYRILRIHQKSPWSEPARFVHRSLRHQVYARNRASSHNQKPESGIYWCRYCSLILARFVKPAYTCGKLVRNSNSLG